MSPTSSSFRRNFINLMQLRIHFFLPQLPLKNILNEKARGGSLKTTKQQAEHDQTFCLKTWMSHKLVDYFYSQPLYIGSDVLPTLSDTALATLKFRTPPALLPLPGALF